MTSIIFHTRGPNTQENVRYVFNFYVSGDVPHLESWKANFSRRSISIYELCTKQFRVLEVSNRVSNWN